MSKKNRSNKQQRKQELLTEKMQQSDWINKISNVPSWIVILVGLLVIISVALWLRVALPYDKVFVGDWVKFTGVDAYYYMRLVDDLVKNFPQLTPFDPYLLAVEGWNTGTNPNFFAYLMGFIIWLVSFGKADQHMIDAIAVYIPPFLAVISIITVFFIGKTLGNKWLGLMAAGLLAIMPGEFLSRSILGYTDHHIAEVMFSTGTLMFMFMAIKNSDNKYKYLMYGSLSGIMLGFYVLTWAGALIFGLIIFLFIIIQSIVNNWRGQESVSIGMLGLLIFGFSFAFYAFSGSRDVMTLVSLFIGMMVSLCVEGISRFMIYRRMNLKMYVVWLGILGIISVLLLYWISPVMIQSMLAAFANVFQWRSDTTVMEMQPLLGNNFSFAAIINNYVLSFFFSLISIVVLLYQIYKRKSLIFLLLLIWSIVILLSALSMRRFAYYYAINVALLTGYLCWLLLAKSLRIKNRDRKKEKTLSSRIVFSCLLFMVIVSVYYPNLGPVFGEKGLSIEISSNPIFAPSDEWCRAQDWIYENTLEPLDGAELYYGLEPYYGIFQKGVFQYPRNSYSILSWWDYGYMTARMGRRIPTANPGTGNRLEAAYFTSQNEFVAARQIANLGVRYVIVDNQIANYQGKFHALASLSGSSYSKYFDIFLSKQGNQYSPIVLFYPEYYRSMASRLYNFDGKTVVPEKTGVVIYQTVEDEKGMKYKKIMEYRDYASYEEACTFVKDYQNSAIVGRDPFVSPVPLEESKSYTLSYKNSQIKIFEYNKDALPAVGDYDGDNQLEPALWKDGISFVVNNGVFLTKEGEFGFFSDIPIVGDWNGDRKDEIGVWRPSNLSFYLDYNGNNMYDDGDKKCGPFGLSYRDVPIAGDWNGDGKDEIGIRSVMYKSLYYLDLNGDGKWDHPEFLLQSSLSFDRANKDQDIVTYSFGNNEDVPLSGDWNQDGYDEIGAWNPNDHCFYLDNDFDGVWSDKDMKIGPYGNSGDCPFSGKINGEYRVGIWNSQEKSFSLR